MSTQSIVTILATSALLTLAACSKSESPAPSSSPAATTTITQTAATTVSAGSGGERVDLAKAREIFNTRCATCHGPEGKGNGPGAITLNPKPRNYHDKEWQSKVTDDDIRKTITYGGAAVGKSPIMPASPDLESKPEVIDGLVRLVRDFGKS
jgi:mono/diheme cytochrome c family protein